MTSGLEERIGYAFRDGSLLALALTHPSTARTVNNQRLEFLGDAVLGTVVAHMLYDLYPGEAEGDLARRHAALVRGETLAQVARKIGVGEALQMTVSEASAGGRDNPSNIEDAIEAVIGAMYLDGGMEAARRFIATHWAQLASETLTPPKDAKTGLQEWAQGRGLPVPSYTILATEGPSHAPQFTIEAAVEGHAPVAAQAASKRVAEQLAAASLLKSLEAL